jgi:hypothetical protein
LTAQVKKEYSIIERGTSVYIDQQVIKISVEIGTGIQF